MEIKAIETQYKGYRFRSRLEARWAVFFDALGVEWEFEKQGYELPENGRYLPDFYLPKFNFWIEVKGEIKPGEMEKLSELAGATNALAFAVIGSIGDHECRCDYFNYAPLEHSLKIDPVTLHINAVYMKQLDIDFNAFPFACPVCETDYVHFGNAENISGNDNYEAWTGRGDAIKIPMFCEGGGHNWTLLFGFHKGNTFFQYLDVVEHSNDVGRFLAGWDEEKYQSAIKKARGARYEFGEEG